MTGQNSQAVKRGAAFQKYRLVFKRRDIKGGGQEMAAIMSINL